MFIDRGGIIRHLSEDEVRSLKDTLSPKAIGYDKSRTARRRLDFILLRYEGISTKEASERMGLCLQTGYNWERAWNSNGIDSIIPNYGGGRPSKLNEEQLEIFRKEVIESGMGINEAHRFVEERFGVVYSRKQIYVILTKLGLRE